MPTASSSSDDAAPASPLPHSDDDATAVPEAGSGLPRIAPDAHEVGLDDIVPTRGYQMTPMVALGGSAGSIAALQTFLAQMPSDTGMIFVVILHLSPDHESNLAALLQRSTKMTVLQAKNGMRVAPDHIYVIPPGKHLASMDGHLRLDDLQPERGRRVAVDIFFRTLADTHGPHSAAIVFSGVDGDGAIGIKRIKERGGLTIAQDPEEAEHSGMPRAAIATGMVDWVLKAAEMPQRLLAYQGNERRLRLPPEDGPHPAASAPPANSGTDEAALRDVLGFLRTRTGRDFSYYKRATILRRISRRMQVNGVDDLPGYFLFLRTHPGEAGALLQDLLISVTNFFRDRDAFQALEAIIPALFANKGPSDSVRVWVAACATGEEAYSIAMLLCEHARTLESPPALQVFATDLDEDVIAAAREGIYPLTISEDVSEELLRRYFVKEERGYRVRREIREIVLFAAHDLLKDSPFSRLDLVSCRNLLIYLNREAQTRAFEIFHFSLRPPGRLFLGSSESVDEGSPLFLTLDKKHRIYARRETTRAVLPIPAAGPSALVRSIDEQVRRSHPIILPGSSFGGLAAMPIPRTEDERRLTWSSLHFKLIERFAPPSVLINADHDIVHLSEKAGRFLHVSGGEPTTNLLRLVHPLLRIELRAVLFRVAQTGEPAAAYNIPVELPDADGAVDIRVAPAKDLAPDFMIVVFEPHPGSPRSSHAPVDPGTQTPAAQHLERELESLKSHLRDIVEEYEAGTEELKASNEELQAMNEELRSATEELETGREELQSINEELTSVNQELKSKVDELGHANSDLHNLMAATAIATVFLDRELRITRYTPSAVGIFRLLSGDIGRPLNDLRGNLDYPELVADAARVLEQLTPVEREVRDAEGRCFIARLLPYRTVEDRIAGVVLTLVDITKRKQAEELLRQNEGLFASLIEQAPMGVYAIDADFRIRHVNSKALPALPNLSPLAGRDFTEIINILWPAPAAEAFLARFRHTLETGEPYFSSTFTERRRDTGQEVSYEWELKRVTLPTGGSGVVCYFHDITERRRAERILHQHVASMKASLDGMAILDADETLVFVNEAFAKIHGYDDPALLVGRRWDTLYAESERAAVQAHISTTLQAEGYWRGELTGRRRDGSCFPQEASFSRIESGVLVCVVLDITDHKNHAGLLEKQVADRTRLLKESVHSLETLSYTMAHDLRAPIRSMLGFSKALLEDVPLDPTGTLYADRIVKASVRMDELVGDLLAYSQLAHHQFPLYTLDLREHIEKVIHDVAESSVERVEIVDPLPAVRGNDTLLDQIISNLLLNALKFVPPGVEPRVVFRAERSGPNVRLWVEDNGIGIAPEHHKIVFGVFQRLHRATDYPGTGVGLAIVARCAERMGGAVGVESEPGRGSRFWIELPFARQPDPEPVT